MNVVITDIQYPLDDHDGFSIFLKSGTGEYQRLLDFPKSEKSFTLTGLSDIQRHCIKLAAYNFYGDGPMSQEVCTTNTPAPTEPPKGVPTFTIMVVIG
jgi:hypothetical protein